MKENRSKIMVSLGLFLSLVAVFAGLNGEYNREIVFRQNVDGYQMFGVEEEDQWFEMKFQPREYIQIQK
ncbi:hypothetical protein [Texcoconibacillus texcoconensis]|uniref:Phosphoribosylanthranilate isomerase n=1 Tax=Texcoconibacillus texcoconensis TaxID=1095777 RepID=A0A840QR87_9BACI|nr:hypothetical protein [Texcoconibacillus texcoconensis]MBB5173976.1 phosphoribosylanthranilate isomerase [Texcoconibacillus texcoconensis]